MDMFDLQISREATSLRQQATDRLRKAILYGHFEPGEKLVEKDLCQQLGISRPLLRESLQHLQAEGLITIIPHKGPMVTTLTAQEANEIYQIRERLEQLAGEGFAANASDQQIKHLRKALEHLYSCENNQNAQRILEAKNKFYAILLEGCGNQVVGQLLNQLNNRVTLLRRRTLSQPGRFPQSLQELEAIVTAIEARDPRRTGRLCAEHVAKAAQVVAKSFS